MKAAEIEAAGINLSLVAWLARHATDVPAIVSGVEAAFAATTLSDKWTALKGIGDVIVADIGDFPGFVSPDPSPVIPPTPVDPPAPVGPVSLCTAAEADAALAAIGDGHILDSIMALVTNPQFIALLELILKLFGAGAVGGSQ